MATTNGTATASWVAADAGAAEVNLCNQGTQTIRYAVATAAPSTDTAGIVLKPDHTHPISVASGSNLYVRADSVGGKVPAVPYGYIDGQ